MSHQEARYEYRSFAPALGGMEEALHRLGGVPAVATSAEVYLLSRADERYNFKIRDGRLELKVLEGHHGRLERWAPQPPLDFPIKDAVLDAALVPTLDLPVRLPPGSGASPTVLAGAFGAVPGAVALDVRKHRERFELAGCIAELVEVTVGSHATRSVCVEGVDPGPVLELAGLLGLTGLPNISYLAEFRSLQGWEADQPARPEPREGKTP